ncbi:plasmid mobilization protein [Clostridium perfringens]|uniref:plasmid mobilization protein n=1 Tax=Clostridium perfringens TaxID=1502 RepID=UPI001A24D701|nr:hypothetical protein [Clostridium perfringens]MDM0944433.1 hypothetical protein [Clostridium perfringens]MDM0950341.1 hypothetical protein [Clostridium perfringens]MDM1004439.1 hypothetical protein [Clostridium perfringens]HAT4321923.1 hypothetical protein [Clostridium perfringens]
MAIEFSRKDMKTKELRVRVTEQEKEQLQKEAEQMNLNLSRYVRYCIFVKENIDELKRYLTSTQDQISLECKFDKKVLLNIINAILIEDEIEKEKDIIDRFNRIDNFKINTFEEMIEKLKSSKPQDNSEYIKGFLELTLPDEKSNSEDEKYESNIFDEVEI